MLSDSKLPSFDLPPCQEISPDGCFQKNPNQKTYEAAWDSLDRQSPALQNAAADIARSHNIDHPPQLFDTGTMLVYSLGESQVLKLYPPLFPDTERCERLCLSVLSTSPAIKAPRVRASGALSGWSYLIMDRLQGRPLNKAWPGFDGQTQIRVMGELGAGLKSMHQLGSNSTLDPIRTNWRGYLESQARSCEQSQRSLGLDEKLASQIPDFLGRVLPALKKQPANQLLHTELLGDHIFTRDGHYNGLFDFGDAFTGDPIYEFLALGIFVIKGRSDLSASLLDGYGDLTVPECGVARAMMAYTLLHRYAHLPWYLEEFVPSKPVQNFEELALAWFGAFEQ